MPVLTAEPLPLVARATPAGLARRAGLALLALPLALAGCGNPCQQLCDRMAEYANDCGLTVTPEDVTACKDEFTGDQVDDVTRDVCAENNSRDQLEEWWTCDDLAENFANGAQ